MKIAYDHQIFIRQSHGGISRYFVELVQNLQLRASVEPTVIAPVHLNEYLLRPAVRQRVRGRFLPLTFRGNGRIVGALNAVLLPYYWHGSKFDVLHETYYSRSQQGQGRVRVLTVYDMIHELFPQEFSDSAQISQAKSAAIRRADHVICISETTRQDAIRLLGLAPEQSSVIYLGWSLDGEVASTSPKVAGKPYVLYVGARNEYKNFGILLEAFASSAMLRRDFELVAFGGRGFSAEEAKEIQRAGLTNCVRHVRGDDGLLKAYYRSAAAFVYPSRYEGFGIPPLEAMANACPVACSNAGSICEVVGDAAAYFHPDDADQLRLILERLAQDSRFAEDLRAKGFECIKKYSWEKCAAETLAVYQSLAGSQAASTGLRS
jgi:glycosyltransferase involved in cell wall biosynthesis